MGKDKSVKISLLRLVTAVFAVSVLAGAGIEWGKAKWQWTMHSPGTTGPIKMEEQQSNSASVTDAPKIAVSPKHKEVLAQPPETISISFEFPVSRAKILLRKGDRDLEIEPPDFSEDGKTLSLPFPKNAGSGSYAVSYDLCPEKETRGCVDGSFEFTVE